ncbi:hypothetical protein ACIOK4_26750 [Streptomyces bottropensis]|uniref:hypothetical protein n=1 Tax=Streptomyces bottropensis TaxID=42235 RepID=UPI00380E234B
MGGPGEDPLPAARPRRAAQGRTLLRHRDDAPEAYPYDSHGEETGTHTALLMPAGAGRFAPAGTGPPVLYRGGDVDPAATTAHGADDEHPGHMTDLLDPVQRANQRAAPPKDPLSTR